MEVGFKCVFKCSLWLLHKYVRQIMKCKLWIFHCSSGVKEVDVFLKYVFQWFNVICNIILLILVRWGCLWMMVSDIYFHKLFVHFFLHKNIGIFWYRMYSDNLAHVLACRYVLWACTVFANGVSIQTKHTSLKNGSWFIWMKTDAFLGMSFFPFALILIFITS